MHAIFWVFLDRNQMIAIYVGNVFVFMCLQERFDTMETGVRGSFIILDTNVMLQ